VDVEAHPAADKYPHGQRDEEVNAFLPKPIRQSWAENEETEDYAWVRGWKTRTTARNEQEELISVCPGHADDCQTKVKKTEQQG